MAQHCSVAILSTAISRMYWYEKLVQIYLTLISQNISSRKYFSVLNKSVVVYDLLVSSWLWLAHTAHFNHIWRIFCQYTNSPPKCPAHLVFIQSCCLVLSKFYEFINKSVWTKKIITTFSRLLCVGRRKWNPRIYPTFGIYWLRSTVYCTISLWKFKQGFLSPGRNCKVQYWRLAIAIVYLVLNERE